MYVGDMACFRSGAEQRLEEAEAALAEAISRCERADEIEAEQNAAREAKAAEEVSERASPSWCSSSQRKP